MFLKTEKRQQLQIRKLRLIETFMKELYRFCKETDLHGWRFVVFRKNTILERLIWGFIIITAIVSVLVLIVVAYTAFMNDPTVILTESTHNMVWNYQFPAVTICNYNRISKSSVAEFTKTLKTNISQEILFQDMKILFELITTTNLSISRINIDRLHDILEENKVDIDDLLKILSPNCEKMINKCKWKGEEKRCRTLFQTERTSNGFCCSFNYYGTKEDKTSNDQQFRKELRTPLTHRRISACGFRTGLEILIQTEPEDYFATQIPSFGHMLLIHPTHNYPQFTSGSFALSMGALSFFSVQPAVTYATESVRNLPINKRSCVFSNEIKLQNFEKYSYQNCLEECRVKITKTLCGCVPFYYPRSDGIDTHTPNIRICNLKDLMCLQDNRDFLLSTKPGFTNYKQNKTLTHFQCKCYKECETYTYNIQLSVGKVSRKYSTNHLDLYAGAEIENSTVIRIFYTDLVAIKNRNDVKYDLDALIAFYGGLLSLFLGFSVISFCEVLYFLVIRTFMQIMRKSKRNKINIARLKTKH